MFTPMKAVRKALFTAILALTTLTSCDSLIYQEEGDCQPSFHVKFKYDMNLKWADAFTNEVKSVRLYIFDSNDILVGTHTETGADVLSRPDYGIDIALDPGKYTLLAWCGIDNPQAEAKHFIVPDVTVGQTTFTDVTCRLNRAADVTYGSVVDKRLEFMFHGKLNIEIPAADNGGDYTYTIPLIKDTNHLRVVLQHLSGEDLDMSQFSFRLEDANGFYASDNTVQPDERLTYLTYKKSQGTATVVRNPRSRESVNAKTVVADLSLGRMVKEHQNSMLLTITNDEGKDIARIPVIDYALLAKDYYEEAYGHLMSDQEFLDRQDEYNMTFFIDDNHEWYSAEIYIESWRIVFQNVAQ